MVRLDVLYEVPRLPHFDLTAELEDAHGGRLGFDRPRLLANFVSTVDGVVAIPGLAQSNKLISDGSEADRFLMGLLRASADAILIGSGTLRASPHGLWTPERAHPAAATAFKELRRRLGLPPAPERVVLTGTGALPESHPVFEDGALVVTTDRGANRLDGRLPRAATILSLGDSKTVSPVEAIAALRALGHEVILSEAGPRLFASLTAAGLVDELFLTVSPLIAGRSGSSQRLGLVEDAAFLLGKPLSSRLLSVRRDSSHLFLRYELCGQGRP